MIGIETQESSVAGQSNGAGKQRGVVKWFSPEKGYGFITPEGGGKDVFLHVSALKASDLDDPREGDKIWFDIEQGKKGAQAVNISMA
jgi:CspA family cold shock protein